MPSAKEYGAIRVVETETYDIENTQYIVSTSEERRRKCLIGFVPVLLFILLMGGIVYTLMQNFNHLYPSPGGGGRKNDGGKWSVDVTTNEDTSSYENSGASSAGNSEIGPTATGTSGSGTDAEVPASKPTKEMSGNSECSYHLKCADAGLTGQCCPSLDGVFLGCC
mmetsp:Transcript_19099/g.27869  ORF Transcript_19099/g.27869 Transcript_19099/m.27869 type:complete len:166 (+) Transcript_19099:206-703(+)